jgi:GT2 family glycosyltransferase
MIDFSVDLVLLSYNHSDLTLRCLQSLKRNTKGLYNLIWIDNGSKAEHFRPVNIYLYQESRPIENFKYYRFNNNKGFSKGMNKGIKMSRADIVVLLNNDITFTKYWLKGLIMPFLENPKIGIVGAVTDNISSVQQIEKIKTKIPDTEYFYNHKKGNIAYFCTAIHRKVINKIGLLDEGFFNGGEDDDYNDRAREAGFKIGVGLTSFVYHDHLATRTDPELNYRQNNLRNRQLLREKRRLRNEKKLRM